MARSRGLTPRRSGAENLLERLGKRGMRVNSSAWGNAVQDFSKRFGHVVGRGATLVARAAASGRKWYRGRANCEEVFG